LFAGHSDRRDAYRFALARTCIAPARNIRDIAITAPARMAPAAMAIAGPGTAQSAAQFGMARVISATGNANLMNSAAARNLTAAKSADIANRVQWTNAYYQMRQSHKAYVASNITRLSTDELNKIAQDQAPKRLDVTQNRLDDGRDPLADHFAR